MTSSTLYRVLWADLRTGVLLGELPVTAASTTVGLNQAGSFRVSVPLGAPALDPLTLAPLRCSIFIERDGVILPGAGILWRASPNFEGDTLDLTGEGFHSYFRHRVIRHDLIYVAADQVGIAKNLIDYAQLGFGNIGILTPAQTSGVLRDRTFYAYERKSIGEAVEQLGAVEGGFDWTYDSAWNGNAITTTFRMTYPPTGRRTAFVFEVGTNCQALSMDHDATTMANSVDAMGAGEGNSMLVANRQDTSSLAAYPIMEDVASFKDIIELATLDIHAGRRLMRGHLPMVNARISIDPGVEPMIGSYGVGDQCRLIAKRGWASVDDTFRIVTQTLNLDESGGEGVQLDLAPLEMFNPV